MPGLTWALLPLVLVTSAMAGPPPPESGPRTVAKAGTNMSLACGGITSSSYVYLIEWVCQGCECSQCPSHTNQGLRLLRYNDKITQWDASPRRALDQQRYSLQFRPVTVRDTGKYFCFINNRMDAEAVLLVVQDAPEAPSNRPMISKITSRSVLLTWASPLNDNHSPIHSYNIFVRENGAEDCLEIDTGVNQTRFLVTGLQPFTTYSFRVAGENRIGRSGPSKESFQTMTHREKPAAAPQFLKSKITTLPTALDLHWAPPKLASINGEFLGYILTYRPTDRLPDEARVLEVRDESLRPQNYSLAGLQRHTTYLVTLAARNLEGTGPRAAIELRTEDGVPLQPMDFTLGEVTSSEVSLSWRPPSNAAVLGSLLLGYRVYIRDLRCSPARQARGTCEPVAPVTLMGRTVTRADIPYLRPAAQYEFTVTGFTQKREGVESPALRARTDTAKPGPPVITNTNCSGDGEILIEWRRPSKIHGRINFYVIYYKSELDGSPLKRRVEVARGNSSDLYLQVLSNLRNLTTYHLAVSAVTNSNKYRGKPYESQLSAYHQVYVSPLCEVRTEMISFRRDGMSTVIIAIILAIVTSLLLLLSIAVCCRRKGQRYELVNVLSPGKCLQSAGLLPAPRGWAGEAESDIPAQLFPKHVQGLHATNNMAFAKDFEALQQLAATPARRSVPDVVGGEARVPLSVTGWLAPSCYSLLLGGPLLGDRAAWSHVWSCQVELIVSLLPCQAKDELALFSSSKFVGEFQLQLEGEQELAHYTLRTLKVRWRQTTRRVTQLVYTAWPDQGPPHRESLLAFLREAFVARQGTRGPVLVCSRTGPDAALYYISLDSVLGQMRATGDANLAHYSRTLAQAHGLSLSTVEMYIGLHDTMAAAIQTGIQSELAAVPTVSRP